MTMKMEKPMEDHMGCQETEVKDGVCTTAPENEKNVDMFTNIDDLNVKTSTVNYYQDTHGFLAEPNEPGVYPGIVMIHEWWGLNDNIKNMAKLLAHEGFVVLAVDVYNGEIATTSQEAMPLAMAARENTTETIANLSAAKEFLAQLDQTKEQKIGSMGWCFGGQQSLNLSLNAEIDATVIYYGNVIDDQTELQKINGPVLGIFAADDTGISVDSVNNFTTALTQLSIPNEVTIYPNVGHAFANPSGRRYAPIETKDAWNKTITFLNENLK
jgi:carboxymethylenebutenolidase